MTDDLMNEIAEEEGLEIIDFSSQTIEEPKSEDDPEPEPDPDIDNDEPEKPNTGTEAKTETGTEVEQSDFLKSYNEKMGTDYESEDDIISLKEDITNIPKYKEYQEKVKDIDSFNQEIERLKSENQKLRDIYDPGKIFVNDAERVRQQLLKKYPDYDPSIMTKIVNTKPESIDPISAIVMKTMLEDGDIYKDRADVIEKLEDEYDIEITPDFSIDSLDGVKRNKLLMEAKKSRKLFVDLKEGINENDGLDIIADREKTKKEQGAAIEKLKEKWAAQTPSIHQELGDIEVQHKDEAGNMQKLSYKIDEGFLKEIKDNASAISEYYAKAGLEPNNENKQKVIVELRDYYIKKNFDKVLTSIADNAVARYVKRQAELDTNPPPPNRGTAPKIPTDIQKQHEEADAEIEKSLNGL